MYAWNAVPIYGKYIDFSVVSIGGEFQFTNYLPPEISRKGTLERQKFMEHFEAVYLILFIIGI